jgi:cell division protein ZapA (FtsZ GTPase activity inhibitor)
METLEVTIRIMEKEFKLVVPRNEEAMIREAAVLVNNQIDLRRKNTGTTDKLELLMMVAFDACVQYLIGKGSTLNAEKNIKSRIEGLDNLIASVLRD